jgi:3-hydroxyisobutyrate dehydrogenase-like beta-hydroxyacid dehydrogenase
MGETVGLIGLGNMGLNMAANLSRAGHPLRLYDLLPAAREEAGRLEGATVVGSAADTAAGAAVVFTVLPNDAIVSDTYLGQGGLLAAAARGTVTCDCSTVSPEVTQDIGGAAAAKGVQHLATPMLGSKPQAITGEIFFIVSGAESALPRIAPMLEAMGRLHMYVGEGATANRIKLIHNVLGAANAAAVAESLALCVQAGVDPGTYAKVVAGGGGMAFTTYFGRRAERVLAGDFSPQFSLALMEKDVRLALGLADRAGLPLPIMEATLQAFSEGLEGGWQAEDFSAVTHVIEKKIGRKLSGE